MPLSDTSWDEQQKLIEDAKTLAEFANLTPDGVASFRSAPRTRDFFPVSWWDYKPDPPSEDDVQAMQWPDMQWQIVQRLIQSVWQKQFQMTTAGFVTLLGCVFDPEKKVFGKTEARPPAVMGWYIEDSRYHNVVRWLVTQRWRILRCENQTCRKYFIAEASQRLYCSRECFGASRTSGRAENKEETNGKRRKNYNPKARHERYLRSKKKREGSKIAENR